MEIKLALIDKAIIVGYFALIVIVGFIMSKVASKGIGNYFLAVRKYLVGPGCIRNRIKLRHCRHHHHRGFHLLPGPERVLDCNAGRCCHPPAFLMVFLGKWYRRSKVMTEAEFMKFRFGEGKGGKMARTLSAVANIIFTIGMVIYFSKGAGNFLGKFVTVTANAEANQAIAALIMILIGLAYTVSSGLYGVVFTDVLQEILIIIVAVFISVKAFFLVGSGAVTLPSRFTEFDLPFRLGRPVTSTI